MDTTDKTPEEIPTTLARDIYLESNRDAEATREVLALPTTPTDVLVEIGENIPFMDDVDEFAALLVSHPNFTDELLERIVGNLKIQWWGDDPIESRLGWEALQRERAAYLNNLTETPGSIYATD